VGDHFRAKRRKRLDAYLEIVTAVLDPSLAKAREVLRTARAWPPNVGRLRLVMEAEYEFREAIATLAGIAASAVSNGRSRQVHRTPPEMPRPVRRPVLSWQLQDAFNFGSASAWRGAHGVPGLPLGSV
jgi:hypothetical protein